MKRPALCLMLTLIISSLLLSWSAWAQGRTPGKWTRPSPQAQPSREKLQAGDYVDMVILGKQSGSTSNPAEIMYSLTVKFTNKTGKAAQVTNNDLFLVEESGRRYAVNRLRFAEAIFLEPEKPVTSDRIYFTVPKDAKIQYLVLYKRGILAGKTSF